MTSKSRPTILQRCFAGHRRRFSTSLDNLVATPGKYLPKDAALGPHLPLQPKDCTIVTDKLTGERTAWQTSNRWRIRCIEMMRRA